MLKKLREKLRRRENVAMDRLFHVSFSKPDKHSHPVGTVLSSPDSHQVSTALSSPDVHSHSVGIALSSQRLDSRLLQQIHKIVDEGVTNLRTIKDSLNKWVLQNTVDISKSSKAFYPSKKVIFEHIYRYTYSTRESVIDQATLELQIESWSNRLPAENKFHYRPYSERKNEPFMFCYQSEWQSHLLRRYGVVVLLDAVYKSAKYSLPVFSLLVKTNFSYVVVGVFAVQWASSELIAEALNVFKAWNEEWRPAYFLVDLCDAEMCAVCECFECKIYICDYHQERAWIRWCLEENIDQECTNVMLSYFRRLSESMNEKEFYAIENLMYHSEIWLANEKLREYFRSTWRPIKSRWACAFLDDEYLFVINTNDGIARLHQEFRQSFLKQNVGKSLPEVLQFVIDKFLVDSLETYVTENSIWNGELDCEMPELRLREFLQNRSSFFVSLVSNYLADAEIDYSCESIGVEDYPKNTKFVVENESKGIEAHAVDFSRPSCTCYNFLKFRFPCTHICAVILYVQDYSFDSLPPEYSGSPFLTVDSDCLSSSSYVDTKVELTDQEMKYEVEILESALDQETSSMIVRPLNGSALPVDTENNILLERIRQLAQSIYESSYQMTPENVNASDLSVVHVKLNEVLTLMTNSIDENVTL